VHRMAQELRKGYYVMRSARLLIIRPYFCSVGTFLTTEHTERHGKEERRFSVTCPAAFFDVFFCVFRAFCGYDSLVYSTLATWLLPMTFTAFWLIALSVLLHVSWNLISKATKPSAAFYLLTAADAAIVSLPFLWKAGIAWDALPPAFWGYFAWGCVANILYYSGLFLSYRHSDISLAYPMVRALPVLFTAVITTLFGIGKAPSPVALFGMLVVFCGCLLMPLGRFSDFKLRNYATPVMGTIVLAALGTTGYTIFDSLAIPMLMANATASKAVVCGAYMCILEAIIAVGLLPYMAIAAERAALRQLFRHSLAPRLSGVFTTGAYMLVLLAMPKVTNVSFVQVFRQMGLPLGVIAGIFLLKEKCSAARLIGMAIIVAGLAIVAMG